MSEDIEISESNSSASAFNASQRNESEKSKFLGTLKERSIHNYFEYNSESDKSECNICKKRN